MSRQLDNINGLVKPIRDPLVVKTTDDKKPVVKTGDRKEEAFIQNGNQSEMEPLVTTGDQAKLEPLVKTGDQQKVEPLVKTGDQQKVEPLVKTGDQQKVEPLVKTGDQQKVEPLVKTVNQQKVEPLIKSGDQQKVEPLVKTSKGEPFVEAGDQSKDAKTITRMWDRPADEPRVKSEVILKPDIETGEGVRKYSLGSKMVEKPRVTLKLKAALSNDALERSGDKEGSKRDLELCTQLTTRTHKVC